MLCVHDALFIFAFRYFHCKSPFLTLLDPRPLLFSSTWQPCCGRRPLRLHKQVADALPSLLTTPFCPFALCTASLSTPGRVSHCSRLHGCIVHGSEDPRSARHTPSRAALSPKCTGWGRREEGRAAIQVRLLAVPDLTAAQTPAALSCVSAPSVGTAPENDPGRGTSGDGRGRAENALRTCSYLPLSEL
ncbi:hypothetical protein DFH08DRAFT_436907 [Mycena albidolilacea]|uniref:Uncharacterized protein n=1 Tax=Mycena albidolilacea TaxID=1033008 RepID=A0AAD7AG03_9AGAR|nr:hypothetical protein DFH08DRAFT_436907 [Mycena albidolilacea]